MDPERAQRAANNKSLRIIKNELEALAERGVITDDQFDTITAALPAEQSLSVRTPLPTPTPTPQENHNPYQAPSPVQNHEPPSRGLAGMHLHAAHADPIPAPPTYQQAAPQGPPATPAHTEVGHAVALWAYNTPDQRDLNFAAGDHVSVVEFVNPEWWMGKNCRTGEEGIFPSNYVRSENYPSPLVQQQPAQGFYGDHKSPVNGGYHQQQHAAGGYQQQPYQAQQQHQDPYQSSVPPVAVAQEGQAQPQEGDGKGGKGQEMGKKIGKKLGNAAIFGAGATIGSNLVNSIF